MTTSNTCARSTATDSNAERTASNASWRVTIFRAVASEMIASLVIACALCRSGVRKREYQDQQHRDIHLNISPTPSNPMLQLFYARSLTAASVGKGTHSKNRPGTRCKNRFPAGILWRNVSCSS
jgi:hypothetical protein